MDWSLYNELELFPRYRTQMKEQQEPYLSMFLVCYIIFRYDKIYDEYHTLFGHLYTTFV